MDQHQVWGVPGTAFLLLYGLIAVVVLVAGRWYRRTRAAGHVVNGWRRPTGPEEVGYLNCGPELAVYAALTAMHVGGELVASRHPEPETVRAVGRPGPDAGPVQRAIHAAATEPVGRHLLSSRPEVAEALAGVRERLETVGLLRTASQRRAFRRPGLCALALSLVGLLPVLEGASDGDPVGFLGLMTIVVTVVAAAWLRVPQRTPAGDIDLASQRVLNPALAPVMRPDHDAVGPRRAALSVATFGLPALDAADPMFREDIGAGTGVSFGSPHPEGRFLLDGWLRGWTEMDAGRSGPRRGRRRRGGGDGLGGFLGSADAGGGCGGGGCGGGGGGCGGGGG